jgi:hypothetical protein
MFAMIADLMLRFEETKKKLQFFPKNCMEKGQRHSFRIFFCFGFFFGFYSESESSRAAKMLFDFLGLVLEGTEGEDAESAGAGAEGEGFRYR